MFPFHYKIVPKHSRSLYFLFRHETKKYKLNIPQMMVGYNSVNMFYFPYSKKKIFYNPLLNVASYGQICLGDNPDLSTSNDPKVIEHNLNHILNLIYNSSWTVEPDMDSYEVYLKHTPDTDYWDRVGNRFKII